MVQDYPDYSFSAIVKTLAADNIIIDLLRAGAYTERRSNLENNGPTAAIVSGNLTARRGKFFPRGTRGFIRNFDIHVDNLDTAEHTFTIKASPLPGMGPVITKTLAVPAQTSLSWRSVFVREAWPYDSMFIWVRSDSDAYGNIGKDQGEPWDGYDSTDEISWLSTSKRYWFRAVMTAQTCGDLPVTGTINTIEIPVGSTGATSGLTTIGAGATKTLLTIDGPGENIHLQCYSENANMQFKIECDGVKLRSGAGDYFMTANLNPWGYTASTPGVSLLVYNAAEPSDNLFTITFPFKWKRKLVISATNVSVSSRKATASLNYDKRLG